MLPHDPANVSDPKIIPAHGAGVLAPSIHNGVPVLQGVRALCLRANDTELCSGGSDGVVYCWDIAGGTVGRIVKKIEVIGDSVVGRENRHDQGHLWSRPV